MFFTDPGKKAYGFFGLGQRSTELRETHPFLDGVSTVLGKRLTDSLRIFLQIYRKGLRILYGFCTDFTDSFQFEAKEVRN